jgi:hypothetical protein
MTGLNRGRYTVTLGDGWRLYSNTIPAGSTALGTIERDGERGALIRTPAGLLAMLNAEAIRSLDQRKAKAAIGEPTGRPSLPAGEAKTSRLELRVNPAERAEWQAKADASGMSLAQWMQDACNRAKK